MATSAQRIEGGEAGQEALLEAAKPEIYRTNAFRITGLPTDATSQQITRQGEKLRMMEKFGGTDGTPRPLPLSPRPDSDQIRGALQRLRDPEARLIEELFWFWPQIPGESRADQALAALSKGDDRAAAAVWAREENNVSSNGVAMHNIAVLSHLLALDIECGEAKPTQEQVRLRDQHWKAAFVRWRQLLEQEAFWSRLTERTRSLEDPRLTAGTTRRIRSSLPLALLLMSAQLAVRAAEKGQVGEARRHTTLIRESGFGEDAIREALHRAVQPVRARTKTLCLAADKESEADITKADRVTRRLVEDTRGPLKVLDCLLAAGDPTRDGAHDDVALQALQCQVRYGNKTEDWKTSVALLELTLPIAASQSARSRIEENLTIVRQNVELGTCFFCGASQSDDSAATEVKMHGDIVRTPTYNGEHIRWQTLTLKIPRCLQCKGVHGKVDAWSGGGALVGLLAGLGSCVPVIESNGFVAFLIFCGMIIVGLLAGSGIAKSRYGEGVRPESDKTQSPRVQEMRNQGWEFGEKPAGVQ